MKASLKFREEEKPLFRAKVPLSILGFSLQSGIVAGESKEFSLNLATFFDSGPSLKFGYRPNDSINPFSLVFKTGIGHFGSPISSPIIMTAEFNLIANQNPTFFVHFKPQIGDFILKKSQSSDLVNTINSKSNGDDSPTMMKTFSVLPSESPAASALGRLIQGTEMSARTILPVKRRAVVKFRWGIRFPATAADPTAGISFDKFPLLVINKIGIEHVAAEELVVGPVENGDVAEACLNVKRQLEVIQAENGMLRKAMDDLRSEIVAGKLAVEKPSGDRRRSNGEKTTVVGANEELKKAASI